MLSRLVLLLLILVSLSLAAGGHHHKARRRVSARRSAPYLNLAPKSGVLPPSRVPAWKAANDVNRGPLFVQPEQVHIAYVGPKSMAVTWITFDDVLDAIVQFGNLRHGRSLDREAEGAISFFVDGNRTRFVSRAVVEFSDDDQPGDVFRYRAGSPRGWSSIFEFRYLKPRDGGGYEVIVYGDLGNENARSMGLIQQLAQNGQIDVIHHIGDYGYDLDTDYGRVGDEFFRQIESAAAYVPYMGTPGNHENEGNFTHYTHRFSSPTGNNLFYSYDLGDAHYISFSTEFYFFTNYGWEQIGHQYEWLKEDLKKANENRARVPWIITMGHRPMYCSDYDDDDCTKYESVIRTGLPATHAFALEKLFYEAGVDLELYAHEHSFERLFPVYNRTVYKGVSSPYVDPPAPVHLVSGSAGCRENVDPFVEHPQPWSAFRSSNYGIGLLRVFNATHLHFRQVAAYSGKTEDEMWLVKHRHGPYGMEEQRKLEKHGTYIPLDHREGPARRMGAKDL